MRLLSAGFAIPDAIKAILETLGEAGFEAFLVGGCVRDMVMGLAPEDWDAASSARPEQVMALFEKTVPTGIRHGTVTVFSGGMKLELTSFRSDGPYEDGRRPKQVQFTDSLLEDLSRRDFTINAMALSGGLELIDPFGVCQDIEAKVIRTVGRATDRFYEDGLRMLRAFRFSASLGFLFDSELWVGLRLCAHRTALLSAERVHNEIEAMLMGPRPEILSRVIACGLLEPYGVRGQIGEERLLPLKDLPENSRERWAALAVLLYFEGLIAEAAGFLKGLRLDSKTLSCVGGAAALCDAANIPGDDAGWKRLLLKYGREAALCGASAAQLVFGGEPRAELQRLLDKNECWSREGLALDGRLLSEATGLGQGRALGLLLEKLLDHVIDNPRDNEKEKLLELAKAELKRGCRKDGGPR